MKWILRIAPKALTSLDVFLRINYSWIWATRIHLTLYFSLLLAVVGAVFGLIIPVDLQALITVRETDTIFFSLLVPSFLAMGYFIFQLCLFSVENKDANGNSFRSILVLILMYLTIMSPFSLPFATSVVLNERISRVIDDKEYIQLRDELLKIEFFVNEGRADYSFFISDEAYFNSYKLYSYNYNYQQEKEQNSKYYNHKDSIYLHKDIYEHSRPRLYRVSEDYPEDRFDLKSERNSYLRGSVSERDSSIRLFFISQNINFNIDTAEYYFNKLNQQIHRLTNYSPRKIDAMIYDISQNNYIGYLKTGLRIHQDDAGWTRHDFEYDDYQSFKNIKSILEDRLSRIAQAKNKIQTRDASVFLSIWSYGSFIICMLVYLFKINNWKQFLLSFLFIGILATILGVAEAAFRFKGLLFVNSTLAILITSYVLLIFTWNKSNYFWLLNQTAIIAYLIAPYIMLLTLGYLDEYHKIWEHSYFDKYLVEEIDEFGNFVDYSHEYYVLQDTTYLVAHVAGIIIFVMLLLPLFHKTFMRLRVLPRNK